MGKEQLRTGNKHENKNSEVTSSKTSNSGGRSGNGGFAMGCGALAVAGFITVASFVTKKNKKKRVQTQPSPNFIPQPQQNSFSKSQEDQKIETQGLPSHLQHSTNPTNDEDVPCHETTIMKNINQPSSPEESIDPVPDHNTTIEVVCPSCFHRQEIVLSDDFPPESAASSNDSGTEEECFNSYVSQTLDMEPQENRKSFETETLDDDDVFTPKEATSTENGNFYSPVVVRDHQQWASSHSVKLKSWVMPMVLLALLLPLLPVIHCTCRVMKHFLERVYGDRRTGPRVPYQNV